MTVAIIDRVTAIAVPIAFTYGCMASQTAFIASLTALKASSTHGNLFTTELTNSLISSLKVTNMTIAVTIVPIPPSITPKILANATSVIPIALTIESSIPTTEVIIPKGMSAANTAVKAIANAPKAFPRGVTAPSASNKVCVHASILSIKGVRALAMSMRTSINTLPIFLKIIRSLL